ncbi:MAG: PqqD family protein [Lachnospiraceae bacterium]|nr:PqqD family protein [Lachnospiraceae bacterium]
MKIEKEFILREIAGDYVIVPTGKTALEFNGLITVNELGAFIWKKLQQDVTEDELIQDILEEYEVDEETARHDVEEFLNKLTECKILG